MFASGYLPIENGRVHFVTGPPSGPPLLLLHGVTRNWRDWSLLLPTLAARRQLFASDFRGHGQSDRFSDRYRVADYVGDARTLLQHIGKENVVVYGHSLGAMVAYALAAEANVEAVILEDPPFRTMGENIGQTTFHALFQGMQTLLQRTRDVAELTRGLSEIIMAGSTKLGEIRDKASLRFSAKGLSQLDAGVLTPILSGQWLTGYDWQSMAKNIRCPVLLLQADTRMGGVLADEEADWLEQSLAECYRIRFPKVGHLIHNTEPAETLKIVTNFLESL